MKPKLHKAYQILLFLIALFWLVGSIARFITHPTTPYRILAALMFINGLFFILLAFLDLRKPLRPLASAIFLLTNLILTFTDQFGLIDLALFILNLVVIMFFFLINNQLKKET